MNLSKANRYWSQFVASLSPTEPRPTRYVEAFCFGTSLEEGLKIAARVLDGTKTTMGSLQWSYDFDKQRLPCVGNFNIITDWDANPLCIIKTTEVQIVPLDEVEAQFAYEWGEGDRTLESWQSMYWSSLVQEWTRIGRKPTWKAPFVCERFRRTITTAIM